MNRKCPACGAELAEGASFCPYCLEPLIEKREIQPPRLRHTARILTAAALIALAAAAAVLLKPGRLPEKNTLQNVAAASGTAPDVAAADPLPDKRAAEPEEPEAENTAADAGKSEAESAAADSERQTIWDTGGAELVYTAEDGKTYRLLARFGGGAEPCPRAEPSVSNTIPPDTHYAYPSQLYVLSEDRTENLSDAFMEYVADCTLSAIPEEGKEEMECELPRYDESFPYAMRMANVYYGVENGTNQLLWSLQMKNGDAIHLYQTVAVKERQTVEYSYEDEPMQTLEELQALLDRLSEELDDETAVTLYLPPVRYEGGLQLAGRAFSFCGERSGTQRTTFTGPCVVASQSMQDVTFRDIFFVGDGGTGLEASSATVLWNCHFSGWDTGALASDGGWITAGGCTFECNGIGLEINTSHFKLFNADFAGDRFIENDTGFLLRDLYGFKKLYFPDTVFERNGTDIENLTENELDVSGAQFIPAQ